MADASARLRGDSRYYDREGFPISLIAMGELFENPAYKVVKQDNLPNDHWVSTVWLGLDHSFDLVSAPMIFESMVFHGEKCRCASKDEVQERYATEDEAVRGHAALVAAWAAMP